MSYVLASEWGVSYATGTGIVGAILNVHKLVDEPNEFGGIGNVVKHVEFDGLTFPSVDAAQEFAFEAGLLKVYVPKVPPADSADAEFWGKLWATRESVQRSSRRRAGVYDD